MADCRAQQLSSTSTTEQDRKMNIAVLDNAPERIDLIVGVLTTAGHICQPFQQIDPLLDYLRIHGADMLLIDWQTTDGHGADLLKTVRSELSSGVPVLFFTHRGSEDDIVAALCSGANDYMLKPLRRGELLTRTTALLKRSYPELSKPEQLQFAHYTFEPDTKRLTLAGVTVDVTQKEFMLALLFFRNLGRPLSRAYIAESVWPHNAELSSRSIDTHVSRVRNKLGLRPENGFRLAPVYSYGYQLEQLSR
jgi:DNA-binding response OmpR family regulator